MSSRVDGPDPLPTPPLSKGSARCTYWESCHQQATGTDFDIYGEFVMGLPEGSLGLCAHHAEEFDNEPGPWNKIQ